MRYTGSKKIPIRIPKNGGFDRESPTIPVNVCPEMSYCTPSGQGVDEKRCDKVVALFGCGGNGGRSVVGLCVGGGAA
jgi:hypothetical protein